MNTTATLADLFLANAPATRAGIEVAGYVVVVEYHAATRLADVRSAVQIDDSPGPIVYGELALGLAPRRAGGPECATCIHGAS